MIIGAISDSHRETKVAASAIEWLLARGADLLVHAGDIVESETLRLLRQSSKPYFAILGNNDEALAELKNEFNLHDEPFCTEFAGLRLKIMHHPFYLFDEEPAAQNEADRPSFAADFGSRTDTDRAANLNSNFNAADVDKILNDARRADVNFKNIHSASANFKSGQSASLNVSLGVNTDSDMNSNANLAASTSPDMNSKASSGADRAVNLTVPSLSANLSTPNSCANLAALSLGSNLTASSDPNASGEGKNQGSCGQDADKIPTIKIYGHTHYFAAAVDKNGALVLNPGEICGRKKRLFGLPALWRKSGNCAHLVSVRSAKNYKATERKS
nr:metallophosphoesterase family protein [uncultured Campylobacter sp.]